MTIEPNDRKEILSLDREALERYQLKRLNGLLAKVLPSNTYYQEKFCEHRTIIQSLDEWSKFPMSCKTDWLANDANGLALHHTFPESSYRRYHRTSGTRGHPMVILDTQSDWQWWLDTWQYVLDACQIKPSDRIMMAFSFGPFIGFWSAHDACLQRGCMVIPCGGMSTAARIDMIQSARPTVLFSTPSYAMHMASDAAKRGVDLRQSSIRQVFVAGEPGGSVPVIRNRIEDAYGARLMDHAGATEVGPWGFGSTDGSALHIIESEFIAEYVPAPSMTQTIEGSKQFHHGEIFELVLTSLGRIGAPVLRYRTGDLVHPVESMDPQCRFVMLERGVLGRVDDMFVVRGVNVFPSSIDTIVRSFRDVADYRLVVEKHDDMDELLLEFEAIPSTDAKAMLESKLAETLSIQLNLRFEVRCVQSGSLPSGEGKAKRVVDRR